MKHKIEIDTWNRKEQYRFFKEFDSPFFNITTRINCTNIFNYAETKKLSKFICYLYAVMRAVNETEEFRLRIEDDGVVCFDAISAGAVVLKDDKSFAFAYMEYDKNFESFYEASEKEVKRAREMDELVPSEKNANVIHLSVLPWIDFTSIQHPRKFGEDDSIPKITIGKITDLNGIKNMPINIEAHHALMDGYHVSKFLEKFAEIEESFR
ncbi:MAG: chloramphenicol acetyltransferase [Bacteroidetes bacterium]|nr:chloramphenicol acetyltransferase [Bacteroidota bacterium]